jgi:hypothetical protein
MKNFSSYLWIFDESAKEEIDSNFFVGCLRKRDVLFNYIYTKDETKFLIGIWEFKNPAIKDFKYSTINQNINLDDVKFRAGEVLGNKSSPEVMVRFGAFFKNSININLDEHSKVEKIIETENYKGFYGTVNKMSFSDEDGEPWVIHDYLSGKEPCMVLLCKGQKSFYAIIISSEKPFDESIIDIFNLSPSNLR